MRSPTKAEWKEFEKAGPGVRMYRGLKTLFYDGGPLVYDEDERDSWQQIIILSGVERIPVDSFENCISVRRVIMADTVKRIEDKAFSGCKSLLFVKLSRNLHCIGGFAFRYCESLLSIFIPQSCRYISLGAFAGCTSLLLFHVHEGTSIRPCNIEKIGLFLKLSRCKFRGSRKDMMKRASRWIREHHLGVFSIRFPGGNYPLHRICCSENPTFDKEYELQEWFQSDDVFLTPLHYLFLNPNTDVNTIITLLTRYHDMNKGEIKKRSDKWIRNKWTNKDRHTYEYPLHERCRSENPTFDKEYTLKEWLEEDDIDLTPLHYIFANPNVNLHTIQPILSAYEQAYNGCEAKITTSFQSNSSEESLLAEVANTSTQPIQASDKVEVSGQKTSTFEGTLPLEEMPPLVKMVKDTQKTSAAQVTPSLKEMPLLDVIVEGTHDNELSFARDSDELSFAGTSVGYSKSVDLLQQDQDSKRVHSTSHDNILDMQSIAAVPLHTNKMPNYSALKTSAVTPCNRKNDEVLDQQHIEERLNEIKEEYDTLITKKIQQLHEEVRYEERTCN